MKKELSLEKIEGNVQGQLQDALGKRIVDKYADIVLELMEDVRKLENSLEKTKGWLDRVNEGDYKAATEYKSARKRLESNYDEDAEF